MLNSEIRRSVLIAVCVLGAHVAFFLLVQAVLMQHGTTVPRLADGMDSEYIPLAHSIREGKFELPQRYFPTSSPVPETFRTPGYPIYIAGVFSLFGGSDYNPNQPTPPDSAMYGLLISLAVLAALISVTMYHLARALDLRSFPATIAALLFGISPAVIFIPVAGMGSDMLFALLFTLALLMLVRLPNATHPYLAALTMGLALGWSGLTRPSGFFLSLIVLVALPFFLSHDWRSRSRIWAVAVASFILILTPWYVRNGTLTGHYELSSIPVYSAFFYNIPEYALFKNGTPLNETRAKLVAPLNDPDPARLRGFEYTDHMKAVDKQFLKENFLSYSVFHAIKTIPFFLGSGLDVSYAVVDITTGGNLKVPFFPKHHQNLSHLVYSGDFVGVIKNVLSFWPATLERLVWAFAFASMLIAPFLARGIPRKFFILSIVLVGVAAILASPVAQPRYRIPIEPMVWIACIFTVAMIAPKIRTFQRGRGGYTQKYE